MKYNCHELKDKGVDVLALCPGPTRTEFSQVAGIAGEGEGMEAEPVVALALNKLGKRPHAVPGITNKIITFMPRLISRSGNIKIGAMAVKKMMK